MPVQIRGVRVTRRHVVGVACAIWRQSRPLAALLFTLNGTHAARTGVSRRSTGGRLSGPPILADTSPAVSIDFLDIIQTCRDASSAPAGMASGTCRKRSRLTCSAPATIDSTCGLTASCGSAVPRRGHAHAGAISQMDAGVHELRVEYSSMAAPAVSISRGRREVRVRDRFRRTVCSAKGRWQMTSNWRGESNGCKESFSWRRASRSSLPSGF